MIEINQYFEIDWDATGRRLKPLLLNRVSIRALSEWAVRDERTIRRWMKDPSDMEIEQLVMIAKFLNIDLLSIIVTKGQQENISLLEEYFDDNSEESVESVSAAGECAAKQQKPRGRPRKYKPNCTTSQQFFKKALYNEYLNRCMDYTPIKTIEEFLLYLPLIDQFALSDFIYRTIGSVCNHREYVHKLLSCLIGNIPSSDAKKYADKMHYFCLCEPNVFEVSDRVTNDHATNLKIEEYFNYRHSDDYSRESEAYYAACCGASERFAFLYKLKMQLEDTMKGQED